MSPRVTTFGNCIARWIPLGFGVADGLEQYVKQEVSGMGEHGREARATRLITERASTRIGKMACEIALQRPRKVRILVQHSSIRSTAFISLLVIILPVICVLLFPIPDSWFFFSFDSHDEGFWGSASCLLVFYDLPSTSRSSTSQTSCL